MNIRLYNFFAATVNIFLSIVGFFIGLRIILRLFSANPVTPFVSWVYSISEFFISPFRGIFPNFGINTGGILDIVAIVTLIGYVFLGYLIISLFRAAFVSTAHPHSTAHYHDIDQDEDEEEIHHHR